MTQQLDQIAFSVVDVQRTERWFRDAFRLHSGRWHASLPRLGCTARAGSARRRLDLLVAGRSQRALPDRAVPVRGPAREIDACRTIARATSATRASASGCRISTRRSHGLRRSVPRRLRPRSAQPGERRVVRAQSRGRVHRSDGRRPAARSYSGCTARLSRGGALGDLVRCRPREVEALLHGRARHAGVGGGAASSGARSALGARRRHHSQRRARRGQRAGRTRAVPRSRRQAVARGAPDQRPGHPQYRLRLPQDARHDGLVPSQPHAPVPGPMAFRCTSSTGASCT